MLVSLRILRLRSPRTCWPYGSCAQSDTMKLRETQTSRRNRFLEGKRRFLLEPSCLNCFLYLYVMPRLYRVALCGPQATLSP